MDRKSQNLAYANKLCASKIVFKRNSNRLLIANTPIDRSASGDPINNVHLQISPCNPVNPSYHIEDYDDVFEKAVDTIRLRSDLQSDESEISYLNDFAITKKRRRMSSQIRSDLLQYKEELNEHKDTTEDLEQKYMKINFELSELQKKHKHFMAKRNGYSRGGGDDSAQSYSDDDNSTTDSDISLQRKSTQIFSRGSSFMRIVPGNFVPQTTKNYEENRRRDCSLHDFTKRINCRNEENKENQSPPDWLKSHSNNLRDITKSRYSISKPPQKVPDVDILQNTISNLKSEQNRFRSIIEQQQHCLQEYHSRCVQAQKVLQTQQTEIEKLNCINRQLESEITANIDQFRHKIETKLREVSQLPQMMRDEQTKNARIVKDNSILNDRIRSIQSEANQMKKKIDEIGRRKVTTMARLKATERDLKIFKNYNVALKNEKRKLNEDLQKMRDQMNGLENSSKRTINRQRDQSEKQRRELQKRIFELEMKLSRSQTSTSSLIQERDCLIAELQTQLNTLVHNFEVSQKHIRILRRHIYSMSGGNAREAVARSRVLVETA